jgi:HEAT repeat protein
VPLLDEPVAKWATEALASFGRLAIGPLVEGMQHKDGGVRAAATAPLTKIGQTSPEDAEAVIAAVAPLMGAYDDYVRAGVVAVLAPLGAPAAPVAIRMLLLDTPMMDQTSAAFRRAQDCAVEMLVAMKAPALEPIVEKLVPDRRERVRGQAALMLGRIAGPLGPEGTAVIPPLQQLISDPTWSVRRRAAAALGELREVGRQPEVLAALTARLSDNPEVKAAAVRSLGMIGAPSSAPALVQTLISNREGAGRELVLALQSLGPEALPALAPALATPDAEARELATEAVAGMNAPAGLPLLTARLGDASVAVRRIAAKALETQATVSVVDTLAQGLGDPDPVVYSAMQRALVRLGPGAVAPLIARLDSGNPRVALVATNALTAIGPAAVPALAGALRSGNAFTRNWAAVGLGELGRPALEATAAVLTDAGAPREARMAATEALGRSQLAEAVAPLRSVEGAADPQLRQAVLRGLAATRQQEATEGLIKGINDPDPAVAMTALRLMLDWQLGDTDAKLAQVVTTGAEGAKRRAAVALAFHESPGTTPLLGALFGTAAAAATPTTDLAPLLNATVSDPAESAEMRRLAVIGLAYRGNQDSVEVLNGFLRPGDPLAGTAARALGVLGGRLARRGGAGATEAQAAVSKLRQVLTETGDDGLRLQAATALSLMQAAPVAALLEQLNTGDEQLKPWATAFLGAIGKAANEEVMRERGRERASKPWVTVAITLIGDAESVKFLQRLPESERAEAARVEAARAVYDRIMKVRAEPFT